MVRSRSVHIVSCFPSLDCTLHNEAEIQFHSLGCNIGLRASRHDRQWMFKETHQRRCASVWPTRFSLYDAVAARVKDCLRQMYLQFNVITWQRLHRWIRGVLIKRTRLVWLHRQHFVPLKWKVHMLSLAGPAIQITSDFNQPVLRLENVSFHILSQTYPESDT